MPTQNKRSEESDQRTSPLHSPQAIAAFAEAQHLMGSLGEDHPRTLMAVIKALNLADPSIVERTARECGLQLPAPTHIGEQGEALFSSEGVAHALGRPHGEVLRQIDDLQGDGVDLASASVQRIQ